MMREFGIADLDELGGHIIDRSRAGMAAAIAALPQGSWHSEMRIDGYDAPIDLAAKVTIAGDHVAVDYAGTSPIVALGINCPMCYTEAYTAFGVKCRGRADDPEQCRHARRGAGDGAGGQHRQCPLAGGGERAQHHRPHAARRCLRRPAPVPAGPRAGRGHQQPVEPEAGGRAGHDRRRAAAAARPSGDDLPFRRRRGAAQQGRPQSPRPSPRACATCRSRSPRRIAPAGDLEEGVPHRQRRRRRAPRRPRPGDGGRASRWRAASASTPPSSGSSIRRGAARAAGPASAAGCRSARARSSRPKGFQQVPPGERLVVEMPGGGGYGDPQRRARDKVRRDVLLGFVSEAAGEDGLRRRLRGRAHPARCRGSRHERVLPAKRRRIPGASSPPCRT